MTATNNWRVTKKDEITYLDCAGSDVSVVGQAGGKWWTIIEGELRLALGELKLLVEGIDLLPVSQHFFFLLREIWPFGHYGKRSADYE